MSAGRLCRFKAGRNRVVAAGRPRMAPDEPAHRQPAAANAAVLGHAAECVRRAGRVVAADLAVERADQQSVRTQEPDEQPSDRVVPHAVTSDRTRARQRARSAESSPLDAVADAGSARTTSTAEPGSDETCSRARCRSRRFTRLRTTALPTALLTTKPIRGSEVPADGSLASARWTTSVRLPDRRPTRTDCRKEAPSVRRLSGGSTCRPGAAGPAVRPRGSCGPCDGARPGSSDPHGCASAGGSRAPCDGGGCSAGTYACSRGSLHTGSGQPHRAGTAVLVSSGEERLSAGTAHPRDDPTGRLLFVDMRHRSTPGDRATVRAGNPQGQTRTDPLRLCLWMKACRSPANLVTFLRTEVPRRPRSGPHHGDV